MRILAVDFGQKHIGTAIGDTDSGIAIKHICIEVDGKQEALDILSKLVQKEHIDHIVFGLPLTFHFEETPLCKTIRAFAYTLAQKTGIVVSFKNEILTSAMSKKMIGAKNNHCVSAQILLQEYFDKMDERNQG